MTFLHGRPDQTPRDHLIGWGESGPVMSREVCRICGAPPNTAHNVVMLGVEETLSILGLIPRGVIGPRWSGGPVPITDARAKGTRTHDL